MAPATVVMHAEFDAQRAPAEMGQIDLFELPRLLVGEPRPRLHQAYAGFRLVDVKQLHVAAGRIFMARPVVEAEREMLGRVGQRNVLLECVAGLQVGAVYDPQQQRALARLRPRRGVARRHRRARQAPLQIGRFKPADDDQFAAAVEREMGRAEAIFRRGC